MHVSFDQANQAIEAAIKEAKKIGTKMCIAVVDSGADLKSFVRMDDAWMGSTDIAIKKQKQRVYSACQLRKLANSPSQASHYMALNIPMED